MLAEVSVALKWRFAALLRAQGCIKLLDFSLSSIGWRRGLGRGGAFLLVSPLLGPLPARSSQGEDDELDATRADGGPSGLEIDKSLVDRLHLDDFL